MRRHATALITGLLLLTPMMVSADAISDAYRLCKDNAQIDKMTAYAQIEQAYFVKLAQIQGTYASGLQSTKGGDPEAMQDQRKQLQNQMRDAKKAASDERKNNQKGANDQYRSLLEQCKAQRDAAEDAEDANDDNASRSSPNVGVGGQVCYSSQTCGSGQRCSTERGVCDSACPPGSEACIQVCAGRCEART